MTPAELNPILGLPDSTVWSQSSPGAPLAPDGLDNPVVLAWLASVQRGEVAADRVAATKWVCRYRIEVLAGMTAQAQANWQSAMLRLTNIRLDGGTLTAEQEADRVFALAADAWKNATRLASDTIEATPGLSPFAEDAPWPPLPDPATVRPVPKYI